MYAWMDGCAECMYLCMYVCMYPLLHDLPLGDPCPKSQPTDPQILNLDSISEIPIYKNPKDAWAHRRIARGHLPSPVKARKSAIFKVIDNPKPSMPGSI